MLHYKKRIESEFDETQLRRANQLMLIDSKHDKGLSTQRPLQAIKSNHPNSYNTEMSDNNLDDNLDADTDHIHNHVCTTERDAQPDQIGTPTEEPVEMDKPPTLGHDMVTFNSEHTTDKHEINVTQTQSVEDKIIHSNYFLNLE